MWSLRIGPQETKVYLGDGTGTFAFSSSLGSSTDLTRAVDLADLNHDGYLDIVEANEPKCEQGLSQ